MVPEQTHWAEDSRTPFWSTNWWAVSSEWVMVINSERIPGDKEVGMTAAGGIQ